MIQRTNNAKTKRQRAKRQAMVARKKLPKRPKIE